MPIDTDWLYEDRVLIARLRGVISDADMDGMDVFLMDGFDRSPFPVVHLIVDTRAITVPTSLRKSLRLKSNRHPRRGWIITVGTLKNPMPRFIVGVLTSMFQLRHREVEEPSEAIEIFQRLDPSLPDLTPLQARLTAFYAELVS